MAQEILPSAHLLEIFNPYMNDEARMIEVLRRTVALGFYRAVELPVFFDAANRSAVRAIIEGERSSGPPSQVLISQFAASASRTWTRAPAGAPSPS